MVEQQTWMTLLGMAGFALALFTYLGAMKRDLRGEIGDVRDELIGTRSELKTEIAACRSELRTEISDCRSDLKSDIADVKADIARLDGRLTTIEQRTYDLSTRLPPAPARPAP